MARGRELPSSSRLLQQLSSNSASVSKEGCNSGGALGLPQAPVFYPTAQEFQDPLGYISAIRGAAEPYGLCRIVPPKGWDPPFALDLQSFAFPTKLQAIHQLQERPAALNPDTFRFEYDKYLQSNGRALESWPKFCGEELDLCKLFNSVKRHGGYGMVMQQRKWGEVLRMVLPDIPPASLPSAAPANLSHLYERHLLEYESFLSEQAVKQSSTALASLQGEEDCSQQSKQQGDAQASLKRKASDAARQNDSGKRCRSGDGAALQLECSRVCEQCYSDAHEQLLLACDRCLHAWHIYCLSPPLDAMPVGTWYCLDCIASEQEIFGFAQGNKHTLDSFRRMCDRFKKKWFGGRTVSCADVEEEFWRIVEKSTGPVEVLYGSDLDTSVYGSGFPRDYDSVPQWAKPDAWEAHARSPWNLNNFPKLDGSMLRLVNENIPGVIVPWLYVGMLFSSFCWHYEDHCFYSVNYLHWGEPKHWYSVPGSSYDQFEEVMRSTFPDLFKAQPDLLFQLVTMLNPSVLKQKGVPVCTALQEAGQFVITFPRSYHGGFNHGFNCAEAVNFAPLDWVPYGRFGVERYRRYHKAAVLSHDELLCVVAKNGSSSSQWLQKEFQQITKTERSQREGLWKSGMVKSGRMLSRSYKNVGKEEDAECIICRYYLHLSAVVCSCRPGQAVCLEHAGQLCECKADKKCLLYRLSLAELEDLSGFPSFWEDDKRHTVKDLKKKVKDGLVTFRKLAAKWAETASAVLKTTPTLHTVEDTLRGAEQFLWAGHEVDSVRPLEKELTFKLNWAKDVAACYNAVQERLHGNKSSRVQLSQVNELLMVTPLPCIEPYASKLKPIVQNTENVRKQILRVFKGPSFPEVRTLQRIQQELLRIPLEFKEGLKAQESLLAAQSWAERVQKHISAGKAGQVRGDIGGISQLRSLRTEGLSLAVMVPEKRLLDVVVKKVESWLQHTEDVLASVIPLQEAEELLLEGDDLPTHLPELETLRKHVAQGASWQERAQAVLTGINETKDYGAALKMLKDLDTAGQDLRVEVKERGILQETIKKFSWMEKATKILSSPVSTCVLTSIFDEAEGEGDDMFLEVRRRAGSRIAWEAKAAKALETGASYKEFSELLSQAGAIDTYLTGLEDIRHALLEADKWLVHARPLAQHCKNSSNVPLEIDKFKVLVSSMSTSLVLLPELEFLRRCLDELEKWSSQASSIQAFVKELLNNSLVLPPTEAFVKQHLEQLSELQEFIRGGVPYNLMLSQFEEIKGLAAVMEWAIEALELISSSPTLESLESHCKRGGSLPSLLEQSCFFKNLEEARQRARTWHSKVTALTKDFEAKVSASLLEKLIAESQVLIVHFESEIQQVQQILLDHRTWQEEVRNVINGAVKLSLSELLSLHETGEASLVQSMEVDSLDTIIAHVGAWLVRCEDVVGANHSSLRHGLSKLKNSAEIALRIVVQGGDDNRCVCSEALDASAAATVCCSRCKDRYHSSCVGMTQTNQQHYICPFCTAVATGAVYDNTINKIQKPSFSSLVELANASKALRCRVEEEELIENVLDAVFTWQERARKVADTILMVQDENHVDTKFLRTALKAASVLRVEDEASTELKRAVSVNAWKHRTRKLLSSSGKPCYRSVRRVFEEAVALRVPATDALYEEVQRRESEASAWIELAQKAVEDGGKMPLEAVNSLIAQGEDIPVTLTREITALRARSVLYCICQTPYDEARGMVGCDRCGEWYHFSCINLPEPESNDCDEVLRDELGPGGEFFCPSCRKVGKTREISSLPEDEDAGGRRSALAERSGSGRGRSKPPPQCSVAEETTDEEGEEGSKARPCRRTAGQHSGFDGFVLLKSR